MILNKIRNICFWIIDFITGSKIRKNYIEIKQIYELDSSSTKIKEYQKNKINNILNIATNNTSYYSKFKGIHDVQKLPIINKNTISENQNDFLSEKYEKSKLIQMSTSGSTGTPFTSYQNIEKKRRVNAETIFFNGKAGYKVGNSLINLRSLNIKSQKSKLKQFIQNENLIDVDKLNEEEIKNIIMKINNISNKQKSTILSYASTYDAITQMFKHKQFKTISNIEGIISTSEILQDETRHFISNMFNCQVFSRYANMENGMLGQDKPSHSNTFIINEANYFIEIIKLDSNEEAAWGEVGRIVITDYFNYAMPMIRYDTGDIGAFTYVEENGIQKKAITNFGGRKMDMIYDADGNYVSPHKISVSFWGFKELSQFQFIQEDKKNYRVLIIVSDTFNQENNLINNLQSILGKTANIKIDYVKEMPVLKSGKFKYIVNNTFGN